MRISDWSSDVCSSDLRDSLITRLSPRDALRSEADAEAVLSALGQVARPGPKVAMKPEVTDVLIEALRGPFKMRIVYGETDSETRTVEPQGLLVGLRSYLVSQVGRGWCRGTGCQLVEITGEGE